MLIYLPVVMYKNHYGNQKANRVGNKLNNHEKSTKINESPFEKY